MKKFFVYGLFYLIQVLILYLFYVLYLISNSQAIFGQILYAMVFILYYFCRDINIEYVVLNIKVKEDKKIIYCGLINFIIHWLLMFLILKGYIEIVTIYFFINYLLKITLDRSFDEVIMNDYYYLGSEYES